jgi:hypothetical protein
LRLEQQAIEEHEEEKLRNQEEGESLHIYTQGEQSFRMKGSPQPYALSILKDRGHEKGIMHVYLARSIAVNKE